MSSNLLLAMSPDSPSSVLNPKARARCAEACADCQLICRACADACLAEPQVESLRRCIALNQACAEVCAVTASLLLQRTAADGELLRAQLQACVLACNSCGTECEMHAGHHEHCRICKDACRRCEDVCRETVGLLMQQA